MVNLCQHKGFNDLGINQGSHDGHNRLIGIDDRAFWKGIDIPLEGKVFEVGYEVLRK